jgi:hypothetical protein
MKSAYNYIFIFSRVLSVSEMSKIMTSGITNMYKLDPSLLAAYFMS